MLCQAVRQTIPIRPKSVRAARFCMSAAPVSARSFIPDAAAVKQECKFWGSPPADCPDPFMPQACLAGDENPQPQRVIPR